VARIRIVFESGEPERIIEFDPRKAPFQHDGMPLEHACGGNCACTTCHVIVKKGGEHLTPSEEAEDDLLDKAPGLTPTSRLGCQAVVEDPDAEIVVVVPRYTINQQV
jgi:ferredoxin